MLRLCVSLRTAQSIEHHFNTNSPMHSYARPTFDVEMTSKIRPMTVISASRSLRLDDSSNLTAKIE
eukprot:1230575-Pleurochrysis_carterae.AAC.1